MALGTVTETHMELGHIRYIKFACVANSSDGELAGHVVTSALPESGGRAIKIVTVPGATAPATDYDFTLKDARGIDLLQGLGADRSATATEETDLIYASTYNAPVFAQDDVFTLAMTNSTKNSAIFDFYLFYALGG